MVVDPLYTSPPNTLMIFNVFVIKKKVPVVCHFSIAQDGKGEAVYVEGIAKCTICHYVARAIFNATYWR